MMKDKNMKQYRVHMYTVVRVPIVVMAENQLDAIKKTDKIDLHRIIDGYVGYEVCDQVEFADEVNGFLVDEVGDEEYENSRYYNLEDLEETYK